MPLKFLFWSLGLCLSGIPLAASIWKTPSKFGDVFAVKSYVGHEGEVLFIAIALGAVTVAEILELAFDLEKSETLRIGITAIIFCALNRTTHPLRDLVWNDCSNGCSRKAASG